MSSRFIYRYLRQYTTIIA